MRKLVKRGEVYFADLSKTFGSEQGGKRPVLIIQNDIGNRHSGTTIIIPLTTSDTKSQLPTHTQLQIQTVENELNEESIALTEQIKVIDKKRLKDKIGIVDKENMKKVEEAIRVSLAFE